jgi:ubiquinone/menaquinone biosynthesis C-methylase UbiE
LLEVGCGEGGNLELLDLGGTTTIGLDFSHAMVSWATCHIAEARFICADAARLPFKEGSFEIILCRDVLHHVTDKAGVMAEMLRVCRGLGRVVIIEPNGRNPIMWLLGMVLAVERDLTRNILRRLELLLDRAKIEEYTVSWAQPFPIGRVLFHYRWGCPSLSAWFGSMVVAAERLIGRLMPLERWAYMVITVVKRAGAGPAT